MAEWTRAQFKHDVTWKLTTGYNESDPFRFGITARVRERHIEIDPASLRCGRFSMVDPSFRDLEWSVEVVAEPWRDCEFPVSYENHMDYQSLEEAQAHAAALIEWCAEVRRLAPPIPAIRTRRVPAKQTAEAALEELSRG